ncbi:MAG: bacteriohemerythrin [Bacteroidales bacterium]
MSLIEWNKALYSVQIEEFDKHHQMLLEFINDLHSAMLQGKGKEVLSKILFELKEYTQYHFSAEEEQMIKANFPGYAEHKKQHTDLIGQLDLLIKDFESGDRKVSVETFKFLKEWLFNHIQVTDKKYTPYLKK